MNIFHCCSWKEVLCGVAVFLLLVTGSADALAQDLKSTTEQPTAQEAAEESQLPPRLAPLGLEKLMDMEVTTVTRTESTVGQSAAAVHVITQEDIRRSGATMIPEVLRRVPGLNVARIDNNKWAIGARGFNARFQDKLLVQMDGRTLYNPLFSGVFWDAVDYPLEDIERIEVVRGPGASVWGANAVNGVINIITKSAKDTHGGLVSGGGGTEEKAFGEFRYGGTAGGNLFYRVYGKGFDRDKQFSQTGDPNDQWWGASGGLRLDWQANERDLCTFDAGYLRSVASRKDLRPTTDTTSVVTIGGVTFPNAFINIEDETTNTGHVLGRWSRKVDEYSNWALQFYWDRLERQFGKLDREPRQYDTFDLDFQQQSPLGDRHKIVYGLGYRYVDSFITNSGVDNGFIVSYRRNNRYTQLFSGFVQDEIALMPDELQLTLGTKIEHNDFTGWEIQPTGRLLWTPTKRQSIWAAISRAVRTPNISEDDLESNHSLPRPLGPPNFPAGSLGFPELRGNRDFESEELLAYELGYRTQATERLSVDLALFYHDYDNLRVTVPQSPTNEGLPAGQFALPVQWQNGMEGETYGVEVGADWRLADWWRLYGAYTYLEMQLHREAGLPASAEAAEGQSPEQQVYLQSSWDLPRNVEFDLIGRFVDVLSGFNTTNPNDPTAPDRISDYFALDARLAWRPRKNLELSLVGQNLLDSHHPESGPSATVRNPLVEIERSVYGKVAWQF